MVMNNLLNKKNSITFTTFQEAKNFSSWIVAQYMGDSSVRLIAAEGVFVVVLPYAIELKDACRYVAYRTSEYFENELNSDILAVLDENALTLLQSPAVTWHDDESGLTWDSARLITSNRRSDYPKNCAGTLNSIKYGGLSDWRLPKIEELKTLSYTGIFFLGLLDSDHLFKFRTWIECEKSRKGTRPYMLDVWSCEKPIYENSLYRGLNIYTKESFNQNYIDSDDSRRMGNYTESAITIMVSGNINNR
jgi:hypothetical protein